MALAVALLILVGVRTYGVRAALFPTWMLPKVPATLVLDRGEIWHLETEEGPVEALFLAAAANAPTVIVTHGNLELIDYYHELAQWYHQYGFSVLVPEYRGYGRSRGAPSPQALVSDVVAFYDRLRKDPAVDATRIYFHGRSVGGAVAAAVAKERQPRALILESTFTSVRQLAKERWLPGFLVGSSSFDSESALSNAPFPVLLIHGKMDDIVPVSHARRLAAAMPLHTLVLLDCGHNDCPLAEAAILSFLQSTQN